MKNIKPILTIFLVVVFGISESIKAQVDSTVSIRINWVNYVDGDFSFKDDWSYGEGIYKNQFGQLSCDGLCPPEIDEMKDESGRIIEDSLESFYALIDTSHLYHSLKADTRTYELAPSNPVTNFISFSRNKGGVLEGATHFGVSVHSILHIVIENDTCIAWIHFNSITNIGIHNFPLKTGTISIDKQLFEEGIIKSYFNFTFENTIEENEELYWSGLIYSVIKED